MSAVGRERLERMGLLPDDRGGAVPVARITFVNRPLFDEGEPVGALVFPDHIEVCALYPKWYQRQSIRYALSLAAALPLD